jgi:hypothetical protein
MISQQSTIMNIFVSTLLLVASSVGSYNLGLLLAEEKAITTTTWSSQQEQEQEQQLLEDDTTRATFDYHANPALVFNVSSSSQKVLEKLVQERLKPPPSLPIWKDDNLASSSTLQQPRQKQRIIQNNELLVHPVLLAHAHSKVVAIIFISSSESSSVSSSSSLSLLSELERHKTVKTTIRLEDNQSVEEWQKLVNVKRALDVVIVDG